MNRDQKWRSLPFVIKRLSLESAPVRKRVEAWMDLPETEDPERIAKQRIAMLESLVKTIAPPRRKPKPPPK